MPSRSAGIRAREQGQASLVRGAPVSLSPTSQDQKETQGKTVFQARVVRRAAKNETGDHKARRRLLVCAPATGSDNRHAQNGSIPSTCTGAAVALFPIHNGRCDTHHQHFPESGYARLLTWHRFRLDDSWLRCQCLIPGTVPQGAIARRQVPPSFLPTPAHLPRDLQQPCCTPPRRALSILPLSHA